MSYSAKSPDPAPFAADGGAEASAVDDTRDPYEVLDDLMTVVEALCTTWPDRPLSREWADFRM